MALRHRYATNEACGSSHLDEDKDGPDSNGGHEPGLDAVDTRRRRPAGRLDVDSAGERKGKAYSAITRLPGGSDAISQDLFLSIISSPGAAATNLAELVHFRRPHHKPHSNASSLLILSPKQHDAMYALAGCADVSFIISQVKRPVRVAMQEIFGIDKISLATWFKNRRVAPRKASSRAGGDKVAAAGHWPTLPATTSLPLSRESPRQHSMEHEVDRQVHPELCGLPCITHSRSLPAALSLPSPHTVHDEQEDLKETAGCVKDGEQQRGEAWRLRQSLTAQRSADYGTTPAGMRRQEAAQQQADACPLLELHHHHSASALEGLPDDSCGTSLNARMQVQQQQQQRWVPGPCISSGMPPNGTQQQHYQRAQQYQSYRQQQWAQQRQRQCERWTQQQHWEGHQRHWRQQQQQQHLHQASRTAPAAYGRHPWFSTSGSFAPRNANSYPAAADMAAVEAADAHGSAPDLDPDSAWYLCPDITASIAAKAAAAASCVANSEQQVHSSLWGDAASEQQGHATCWTTCRPHVSWSCQQQQQQQQQAVRDGDAGMSGQGTSALPTHTLPLQQQQLPPDGTIQVISSSPNAVSDAVGMDAAGPPTVIDPAANPQGREAAATSAVLMCPTKGCTPDAEHAELDSDLSTKVNTTEAGKLDMPLDKPEGGSPLQGPVHAEQKLDLHTSMKCDHASTAGSPVCEDVFSLLDDAWQLQLMDSDMQDLLGDIEDDIESIQMHMDTHRPYDPSLHQHNHDKRCYEQHVYHHHHQSRYLVEAATAASVAGSHICGTGHASCMAAMPVQMHCDGNIHADMGHWHSPSSVSGCHLRIQQPSNHK